MTAGSLDWFTTVIGITYFGAIEGNPLMAPLTSTNLLTYSVIKIVTTILVGFIFYKAEKILQTETNHKNKGFKFTRIGLRVTYFGATFILLAAVINNIIVVARAI